MSQGEIPPDVIDFAYRRLPFIFCKWGARLDIAEELTQETVIAAWQSRDTFRGDSKWSTWVVGVAHNLYRNHVRKILAKNEEQYDPELDTRPDWTTPDLEMEAKDLIDDITARASVCIETERHGKSRYGPKRAYSVDSELLSMWLGGATYEEMSVTKNLPIGTVRSRIHRTLRNTGLLNRKQRGTV